MFHENMPLDKTSVILLEIKKRLRTLIVAWDTLILMILHVYIYIYKIDIDLDMDMDMDMDMDL